MKRVLGIFAGLLAILSLTTPSFAEQNLRAKVPALNRPNITQDSVAPLSVITPAAIVKTDDNRSLPVAAVTSRSAALIAHMPQSGHAVLPEPLWLAELNLWRRMAGLNVIVENSKLSLGSAEHARYLVVQGPADVTGFRAYDRSIGPRAHVEETASRYYTRAGAIAAIGGPLAADVIQGADVAWEGRNESGDIDSLITAPFHRLSLLAPWAQIGGYGSFGEYPRRAAALALRGPLKSLRRIQAIEFPPPNSVISLNMLSGSEWPNPIAACHGFERPVGLPITVQTGHRIALHHSSICDNASHEIIETCGLDAATYRNSDSVQQKRGRELLNAYGAVMLIPRRPLSFGHQYSVAVQTSQGNFDWSFEVKPAAEMETAQTQRTSLTQATVTR